MQYNMVYYCKFIQSLHEREELFFVEFNVNSPVLFVIAGLIIAAVLAQSVYFLIKAWKRGLAIGMGKEKLRRIGEAVGAFEIRAMYTDDAKAKDLGVPLPWLRLSVVGSLSYETIAASNAEGAMGLVFGQVDSLTASQYVTIAWVMTISIMLGIWLVPLIGKKLQGGMTKIENRDKRWGDILSSALFIGMIAAFLGYVFCDFGTIFHGDPSGLIPVCVMIVSAVIMALCGLIMKKTGWHWVGDYALPMSLILGMASAIPITGWLS